MSGNRLALQFEADQPHRTVFWGSALISSLSAETDASYFVQSTSSATDRLSVLLLDMKKWPNDPIIFKLVFVLPSAEALCVRCAMFHWHGHNSLALPLHIPGHWAYLFPHA